MDEPKRGIKVILPKGGGGKFVSGYDGAALVNMATGELIPNIQQFTLNVSCDDFVTVDARMLVSEIAVEEIEVV